MVREYADIDDFLRAWSALHGDSRFKGLSPGGAAAVLGVTRQRVHQLIASGQIDAVRIFGAGHYPVVLVDQESFAAYRLSQKKKAGWQRLLRLAIRKTEGPRSGPSRSRASDPGRKGKAP